MTVALHMNETEDTGSLLFLYAPFPAHTKKRHIQRSGRVLNQLRSRLYNR